MKFCENLANAMTLILLPAFINCMQSDAKLRHAQDCDREEVSSLDYRAESVKIVRKYFDTLKAIAALNGSVETLLFEEISNQIRNVEIPLTALVEQLERTDKQSFNYERTLIEAIIYWREKKYQLQTADIADIMKEYQGSGKSRDCFKQYVEHVIALYIENTENKLGLLILLYEDLGLRYKNLFSFQEIDELEKLIGDKEKAWSSGSRAAGHLVASIKAYARNDSSEKKKHIYCWIVQRHEFCDPRQRLFERPTTDEKTMRQIMVDILAFYTAAWRVLKGLDVERLIRHAHCETKRAENVLTRHNRMIVQFSMMEWAFRRFRKQLQT